MPVKSYVLEKKISAAIDTPKIRKKFKILPMPKYLRIKKKVIAVAVIIPLLVLIKRVEKVRTSVKKTSTKNKGTAPRVSGSTK